MHGRCAVTGADMSRIADALGKLDIELFEAEKADNLSTQITVLRERSRVWREWADLLERDGRESWPAILASQRDAISADQLSKGISE